MKFKAVVKGDKHHKIELPSEIIDAMQLRKGSFVGIDIEEIEDESEES